MTSLVDETDRGRRLAQHGAILLGVVVLILAAGIVDDPGRLAAGLGVVGVGFLLFVASAVIKQRWTVHYKGHEIRFENNPFTGERLFVDGVQAAKGQLGFQSRMGTTLSSGDRVVVIADAGFLSYRCRIGIEP